MCCRRFAPKSGRHCTTTPGWSRATAWSSISRSVWGPPGGWPTRSAATLPSTSLLYCTAAFQNPAYCIEYETRNYTGDLHVRFHSSNPSSEVRISFLDQYSKLSSIALTVLQAITTYLWPALLEGVSGPCVQKGVVITWNSVLKRSTEHVQYNTVQYCAAQYALSSNILCQLHH